ncbi:MAG: DUF721 domain-containing protein [Coriobacteriia bacterium]|nr:DUF721 domain-containing protein [Coriobacteriia bacterium]
MGERRGRMVRVGEAMRSLIRSSDRAGGLLKARATEVWAEVVGPDIARHTVGMGVRAGELNVHVDSHAWATQLTLMADDLRKRVNEALGENAVRHIRFTVSRVVAEKRDQETSEREAGRRYGGERVEPVSVTVEERREIEEAAAGIENESLREAAIRARIRDRELKKGREKRGASQGPPGDSAGPKKPLLP